MDTPPVWRAPGPEADHPGFPGPDVDPRRCGAPDPGQKAPRITPGRPCLPFPGPGRPRVFSLKRGKSPEKPPRSDPGHAGKTGPAGTARKYREAANQGATPAPAPHTPTGGKDE